MKQFARAILSGVLISAGAWAYAVVGGVVGAILFSFGLITILCLGTPLYTGCVGSTTFKRDDLWFVVKTLFGNLIGCLLISLIFTGDVDSLTAVEATKMSKGFLEILGRAIMCGLIVDVSVYIYKNFPSFNPVPVLIGVPLFILSGFYHSIAEPFYIFSSKMFTLDALAYWGIVLLGNTIGCNIRRFLL